MTDMAPVERKRTKKEEKGRKKTPGPEKMERKTPEKKERKKKRKKKRQRKIILLPPRAAGSRLVTSYYYIRFVRPHAEPLRAAPHRAPLACSLGGRKHAGYIAMHTSILWRQAVGSGQVR